MKANFHSLQRSGLTYGIEREVNGNIQDVFKERDYSEA
jgi:hypothetical protein